MTAPAGRRLTLGQCRALPKGVFEIKPVINFDKEGLTKWKWQRKGVFRKKRLNLKVSQIKNGLYKIKFRKNSKKRPANAHTRTNVRTSPSRRSNKEEMPNI